MKNIKVLTFVIALTLNALAQASTQPIQPQNTTSANWSNAYTAADGTIWSDILPDIYANCISIKDDQGHPISYGNALCEQDSKGNNLGLSSDGLTVIDSDAIRACQSIGGNLPSLQDFLNLKQSYNDMPHVEDYVYWSSSIVSYNPNDSMCFGNADGEASVSGAGFSGSFSSVRCITH